MAEAPKGSNQDRLEQGPTDGAAMKHPTGSRPLRAPKAMLLLLLAVSALLPMLFLDYNEPSLGLLAIKVLAKVGSLVGTMLLVWQLILGFRIVSTIFHKDLLWLVGVHEKLGTFAIPLILLHPVCISIYYAWTSRRAVWAFDLGDSFYWFVLLGMTALALLLFIFTTSVFLRKRLGYGRWFAAHLTTYAVLPLAFAHAIPIGMTLEQRPLMWFWLFAAGVAAIVLLSRALNLLGWRTHSHEVIEARRLAPDAIELSMKPLEAPMTPEIGQFVYVRRARAGGQRPYSVARYEEHSGKISIGAQSGGRFSQALQKVRPSERMYLDGPYGVFSQDALLTGRPLVMVAGGIGITAFLRLLEHMDTKRDRPAYLFYGNEKDRDIAYREEVGALEHVKVVHVMSDQPDFPGEKGLITAERIGRHVHQPVQECEILMCGPGAMTRKLQPQLVQAGVPRGQIHYEMFAF